MRSQRAPSPSALRAVGAPRRSLNRRRGRIALAQAPKAALSSPVPVEMNMADKVAVTSTTADGKDGVELESKI